MTSSALVRFVAAGAAASVAAMYASTLTLHRPAPAAVSAPAPAFSPVRAFTAPAPVRGRIETPAQPAAAATFEALEQALAAADPSLRDRVLAERLPALTLRDPARAARFAELLEDARLRELALLQVAMTWARHDATTAVYWAESLVDPVLRDAAITDISLALAETDAARAVALRERFVDAGALPPDNTLVNLAHQWAEQDFAAARAWADALPPGAQRDQVLQRLVFVRAAAGDFSEAAELARSSIAAPAIRAEALATVAQQQG